MGSLEAKRKNRKRNFSEVPATPTPVCSSSDCTAGARASAVPPAPRAQPSVPFGRLLCQRLVLLGETDARLGAQGRRRRRELSVCLSAAGTAVSGAGGAAACDCRREQSSWGLGYGAEVGGVNSSKVAG